MRVQVIDPSAFTPPYDHALCAALAAAGADVELVTSRFGYGPVPHGAGDYAVSERFYRWAPGTPGSRARFAAKLVQHVPDMLAWRRHAAAADVLHFQWLTVQPVDARLLPRARRHGGARPIVLTAHDVIPREPRRGQVAAQRRLYERVDAVIVHSEHGARRLTDELGVDAARVHVIPHGAFGHLVSQPREVPLAAELAAVEKPVVLCFGLLRPYKGIDVLLRAWAGIGDAELWIVGMPRMDVQPLRAMAPNGVRFVPRFVTDPEIPALFRRADLVVLPYREIDQSGVLFTALAFGRPLLLSAVGGFPEIAATGAAELVAPGDAGALHEALTRLIADPRHRAELAAASRAAADGPYSWEAIGRETVALYERLLAR
jgi:glycosyltransferase involved in cell wall biosynthesis